MFLPFLINKQSMSEKVFAQKKKKKVKKIYKKSRW